MGIKVKAWKNLTLEQKLVLLYFAKNKKTA